jgi:hypothetical protein
VSREESRGWGVSNMYPSREKQNKVRLMVELELVNRLVLLVAFSNQWCHQYIITCSSPHPGKLTPHLQQQQVESVSCPSGQARVEVKVMLLSCTSHPASSREVHLRTQSPCCEEVKWPHSHTATWGCSGQQLQPTAALIVSHRCEWGSGELFL